MTLTDEDIIARLTAVEDATVERKTSSDNRDWIKAAVAFSNTLENDQPGVLFVGLYDDGRIEDKGQDSKYFENLQNRVNGELSNINPPIYTTVLVREKEGKKFLAVVIYGSPNRPHFAGKSYRRDGTKTVDASEENIKQFITLRSSKVAEIIKWKGQEITLVLLRPEVQHYTFGPTLGVFDALLVDCTQHYITAKYFTAGENVTNSFPLRRVEVSSDNKHNRLALEVSPS
jgi:hypothetical protein